MTSANATFVMLWHTAISFVVADRSIHAAPESNGVAT